MYVNASVYVYSDAHTHICIYVCIYIYIHTYISTRLYMCICIYMFTLHMMPWHQHSNNTANDTEITKFQSGVGDRELRG